MSELLTTGQMIDQLKVGEIAESSRVESLDNFVYRVKKSKSGSIMTLAPDMKMTGHLIPMQGDIIDLKWRILPKFVTFEEAMQAGKEGKTVFYHTQGEKFEIAPKQLSEFRLSALSVHRHSLLELFEGKWSVEES